MQIRTGGIERTEELSKTLLDQPIPLVGHVALMSSIGQTWPRNEIGGGLRICQFASEDNLAFSG